MLSKPKPPGLFGVMLLQTSGEVSVRLQGIIVVVSCELKIFNALVACYCIFSVLKICDPHSANITAESTTHHNMISATEEMSELVNCVILTIFQNLFVIHCLYTEVLCLGICWMISLDTICEIFAL